MTWAIENPKYASANKVAIINLEVVAHTTNMQLQDYIKSPSGEMEVKFQLNRDTLEDMLAGWKLFGLSTQEAEAVELFYLIPIPVTLVSCPMVLVLSSYTCTKIANSRLLLFKRLP
ncbi:hypothetical protein K2173_003989 [Erythroxylum novogranatense]|uniref:Uncharacterized protein n=1 Tax=Erythroxylum novogranatense TaxID=1862640 RepID=A0AAV8SJF7_9ROSI|nr:hypothetical protein K2173_003989 [Erythroxylum novogranatense]